MIFSPGAITCFFHRYLFHFAVGEGGGAAVGGSLDHPSDHDPRRTSAAPMTLISDKSQTKQTPLEVNVGSLLANEPPGRVVTPPAAPPAGKRITRSSNKSINEEEREGKAAEYIYKNHLKLRGWSYVKGDDLNTVYYVPGSLKGLKNIKADGDSGVHYGIGEPGLCQMLQTYGLDHAPKDLDDEPEKPQNGYCIYSLKELVDKNKEAASKKAKESRATELSGAQATSKVPAAEGPSTSKRKRGSRPVNLSDQAAKKSKPAAGSQTSKDIAVVSNLFTERDNKILALKTELESQKTLATCEKEKLEKKLDEETNEVARLRDELARTKTLEAENRRVKLLEAENARLRADNARLRTEANRNKCLAMVKQEKLDAAKDEKEDLIEVKEELTRTVLELIQAALQDDEEAQRAVENARTEPCMWPDCLRNARCKRNVLECGHVVCDECIAGLQHACTHEVKRTDTSRPYKLILSGGWACKVPGCKEKSREAVILNGRCLPAST